jgi:hypothetical protein
MKKITIVAKDNGLEYAKYNEQSGALKGPM